METRSIMKKRQIISKLMGLITPIIFLQTLFFKFSGAPESIYIFTKVGMEPWGRIFTGCLELLSSILFFIPGLSWLGSALAIDVMIGAIFSHFTLLGVVVQNDSGLLFGMAWAVVFSSSFKLYQERYRVPLIGILLKQSDDLAKAFDSNFKPKLGRRLPIILIVSFAIICAIGIAEQIIIINKILSNEFPQEAEIKVAQWSYFMTLISVFITFVITAILVRLLEKPLHELIRVCQKISNGDRATRSHLPLQSEFGILSQSLNNMLEEVQQKEAQLLASQLSTQRLFRVVIHDIANPLTVILNYSKMILMGKEELSETQKKYWNRVSNAGNKIESIIKVTRDFEAVRSGVKKIELKNLEILKCLESVVELFHDRAKDKGIKFTIHNLTESANPEILAEETLFSSSVISNIVSNAIKFSPEGGSIEFLVSQADADYLLIAIVDHGVGLPKEMLEKFRSGENIQSRVGTSGEAGTGFGLDIARTIMKTMNGDLKIESQTRENSTSEHGTRVLLFMPIAKV